MERKIFITTSFFVMAASFTYVLTSWSGLNLPRYYPVPHQWSVAPLEGPSMAYYAKVTLTLLFSGLSSALFFLLFPLLDKHLHFDKGSFKTGVIVSLLWGSFFFIVEEWHEWGILKRKLDTPDFLNSEFTLFLVSFLLFVLSLLFVLAIEGKFFRRKVAKSQEPND